MKIKKTSEQRAIEWLKYSYKMTQEVYDTLLQKQDGKCSICRVDLNTVRICVDHDHACCPSHKSCGKCIRGLLCHICNARLSALEDLRWRVKAESYLHHYNPTLWPARLSLD